MIADVYESMLKELEGCQQHMLSLEKEKALSGLRTWYKKAHNHFSDLVQNFKHVKKGDPGYLLKNQGDLILKNLNMQETSVNDLLNLTESQILQLFEKQFKLKKIIRSLSEI